MIFTWQKSSWKSWADLRGRLPHALMIRGAEGTGIYEFAQEIAQAALCEKPAGEGRPCGTCPACGWFAQGNHPDYRLVVPESLASERQDEGGEPSPQKKEKRSEQIRIEQIRELGDFLAVGTHRAGLRVILIYPAEAMNASTQNALLKSLEEPPPATLFLVATTQPDRLLATVRSRCRTFVLPFPETKEAQAWLKEQGVAQPEAALARAGGAPLAALKAGETETEQARFLDGVGNTRFDPLALADRMQKVPLPELVGWLQRWGLDLLLSRSAGKIRYYLGHEKAIASVSSRCEAADIAAFLRRLAQAKALSRHPLNARLFVEDLLLQYRRLIGQP